jgi:hypothetical protein
MHLSQLAELVFDWKTVNSHKDMLMRVVIVGVHLRDENASFHVEHRNNKCWLFSKPDRQSWDFVGQVCKVYLERLFVVLTHLFNPVLVGWYVRPFVAMSSNEVVELTLDEFSHVWLLNPLRNFTLHFRVVIHSGVLVPIILHFLIHLSKALLPAHAVIFRKLARFVSESVSHPVVAPILHPVTFVHLSLSVHAIFVAHIALIFIINANVVVSIKLLIRLVVAKTRKD